MKLEPFLGEWCFDQFPTELGSLDENVAISLLHSKHEQIETYFKKWGDDSFASNTNNNGDNLVDIEPYVGQWCAAQYPKQITTKTDDLVRNVQANHVKFEPALARWCFAQFPNQLSTLNADTAVQDVNTNHELVENELIKWVLSTQHTPAGLTRTEKGLLSGLVIFASAFCGLLAAVVMVGRCRRKLGKDVDFTETNNGNMLASISSTPQEEVGSTAETPEII